MHKPVFLVGMPGSGKSTIGRLLAKAMDMPFLDLDEYLEATQGKSVREIFTTEGESYFRQLESESLREVAGKPGGFIVATGGGTPCFSGNMDFMNEAGITVYLKVPNEAIASRLMSHSQEERPLIAGKSPFQIKQFVTETLEVRLQFYEQAHITYQNAGWDITNLCRFIKDMERTC